jgi:ATP-dependent RNA helicase MSS116
MFGALRRCPASLSKTLPVVARSSNILRTPLSLPSNVLRLPHQTSRLANASIAGFHHSAKWQQIAAVEAEAAEVKDQNGPITEFQELARQGLVHPNLINTITKNMRLTTMTDVQTRTINEALSGVDV